MGINSIVNETTFITYARTNGCIVTITGNKIEVTDLENNKKILERNQSAEYYREIAKLLIV